MKEASRTPIPIDRGRQLFVDDFLIEESTLQRSFHRPRIHPRSPVLVPQTEAELNNGVMSAAAMPSVAYDPTDRRYKMWYLAGYDDGFGYAESEDGLNWSRPSLDIQPGTNRILAPLPGYIRNGSTVCLDLEAPLAERFKMFAFYRAGTGTWPRTNPAVMPPEEEIAYVFTSHDGIHWTRRAKVGPCGDNTSLFRNPFRGTWAYSIRTFGGARGRIRSYYEHPDFVNGSSWNASDVRDWLAADHMDRPDPLLLFRPELYKVDCVAYESLMIGLFALYKGPPNHIVGTTGTPKILDLIAGYSRDGLKWDRPDRTPFLASSRTPGAWDRGYVHAAGGICVIANDELRFYFSAFSGGRSPYSGGSTGLAILRRDGFASMDGPGIPMPPITRTGSRDKSAGELPPGSLTTRPVLFSGSYLFINANIRAGSMQVEVVDEKGFSTADCLPITGDSTRHPVRWKGALLGSLSGKPVRFRFHFSAGELYSFWVSSSANGASQGYVAAGGPGFISHIDTTGA